MLLLISLSGLAFIEIAFSCSLAQVIHRYQDSGMD
jgi:hypothetical protein